MTVAEMRRKELERFVRDENITDVEGLRKAVNSFYRLCGIEQRLLYLENDEHLYFTRKKYIDELNIKRNKAYDRVVNYLIPFGLTLTYFGYTPTIVYINKYGKNVTAIEKYFY